MGVEGLCGAAISKGDSVGLSELHQDETLQLERRKDIRTPLAEIDCIEIAKEEITSIIGTILSDKDEPIVPSKFANEIFPGKEFGLSFRELAFQRAN